MGIIDHQPGVAGMGCGGQGRQVGDIAIHAEHPIGDHQRVAHCLVQAAGQAGRVVMQITVETCATEQPGIEQ
ncbi:hypothetical protein D3C81_2046930 [compost metagenome]